MSAPDVREALERVSAAESPDFDDLVFLLGQEGPEEMQQIFDVADRTRRQFMGDGILLRGIVEFSSFCRNTCAYCGLHAGNSRITRYRMRTEDILESIGKMAAQNIRTVVLQSGEDEGLDPRWAGGGCPGSEAALRCCRDTLRG